MYSCQDALPTQVPYDITAIEELLRNVETDLALPSRTKSVSSRRLAALLWDVYCELVSHPTGDGFPAWLTGVCVEPSVSLLRRLLAKLQAIDARFNFGYSNDGVLTARVGWLAWRFCSWSTADAPDDTSEPASSLARFESWLTACASYPATEVVGTIKESLSAIDDRLRLGFSSSPVCSACMAARLWRIGRTQGIGLLLSDFNDWVGELARCIAPDQPDDLYTDYVLAAASCCGQNHALREVDRQMMPLIKSLAHELGVKNTPTLGDILFSGRTNAICAYEGRNKAKLKSFLYRVVRRHLLRSVREERAPLPEPPSREEHDQCDSEFVRTLFEALPYGHALALRLVHYNGLTYRDASLQMIRHRTEGIDFECRSRLWRTGGGLNRWLREMVVPQAQAVATEAMDTGRFRKRVCECRGHGFLS